MPNYWQIRSGQTYSRNFNLGIVRAGYNVGVNPVGAGNVGATFSVGVGIWEGRGGYDLNGNFQLIGGVGLNLPKQVTRNFGQLRAFTGIGYSSIYGGVDVTDIELRFNDIGPGQMRSGIRYQNQTPLSEILGRLLRRRDPMVIDLNSDGLTLTPLRYSTAAFDFGGDGAREHVGWVGPNEGIIVSDVDGDGKIASLADLFGDGEGDAFLKLAQYDLNGDGAITADDAIFASLRIWRDTNGDGTAQTDELVAPTVLSIKSINLAHSPVLRDVGGNRIVNAGTVTLQSGASLDSYSVEFASDGGINAGISPDVDLPGQVLTLPNLHGFGAVRELWDWALSDPENLTALKAAVSDFGAAESLSSLVGSWSYAGAGVPLPNYHMSTFEKFVAKWAGASGETDDDRIKATAEKFAGRELALAVPGSVAFYNVFREFTANLAVRFIQQVAVAPMQAAGVALLRELSLLGSDALASMTEEQMQQVVSATVPAGAGSAPEGNLASSLFGVRYDFSTDTFPEGLAQVIASLIKLEVSDGPSEAWSKLRELNAKDPWLFKVAEGFNPDPAKGTVSELALRIASNNTVLPVHSGVHTVLTGTSADEAFQPPNDLKPLLVFSNGGSDTISGGGENTTVVFEELDGNTLISDSGGTDEIAFISMLPSDVSYQWVTATNQFTIRGGSGSVTVKNAFDSEGRPTIERISFADGTVYSGSEIRSAAMLSLSTSGNDSLFGWSRSQVLTGGAGDDTVFGGADRDFLSGGAGADRLDGGGGDDLISGDDGDDVYVESGGNDTYLWSPDHGDDTLVGGGAWDGYNVLELPDGVSSSDLRFSYADAAGEGIRISVDGHLGSFTITKGLSDAGSQVDEVLFGSGNRLSRQQLLGLAMVQLAAVEGGQVWGSQFADVLSSGDFNDTLRGRGGNDTLIGGTGNDVLTGGAGDDTYVFNLGDGQDIVRDYGGHWSDAGGYDRVQFGADISPNDIIVTQVNNGQDLLLSIAGTDDRITIERTMIDGDYRIEKVGFDDGTTWSHSDLVTRSMASSAEDNAFYGSYDSEALSGGAGNDTLRGRGGNDTLIGGTGNDVLTGGAGDDTYVFNLGDGQDIVRDYGGHWSDAGGNDTLTFGEGINPGDVTVTQTGDGNHLVLSIAGTTDKVTMERAITDGDYRIEKVGFADGTTWSYADLVVMSAVATAEADTIYGDSFANTLSGLAGNDTLRGRGGNDTLIGGTGNDVLTGGAGDDTYVFNLGDGQDIVRDYGGHWSDAGGNDTLTFGEGINPGDVTVTQTGDGNHLVLSIAGTTDKVTMERAITDGDYRIEKVGFADGTTWSYADLVVMSAVATAEADTIYGDSFANTLSGLAGNDTLRGRGGNDTLIGGTGNDVLTGGAGDDTYVFNLGDGQDIVRDYGGHWSDAGGNDTLTFGEGINPGDVTVTQTGDGNHLVLSIAGTTDKVTMERAITDGDYRIEKVGFADGTTWSYADLVVMSAVATAEADTIYGDSFANTLSGLAGNDTLRGRGGNDTLIGGTGNDVLTGGAGDDTYVFNLGDGQDIVRDYGGHWSDAGGNDTLTFGEGINPGDVTVTQIENGRDLVLSINGTTDKVTIERAINDTDYRIEQVRFANGTTWSYASLLGMSVGATAGNDVIYGDSFANTLSGLAGNDTLRGRGGNDTLIGGTGNDVLTGGAGDDTYVFNLGDGQDIVRDYGGHWSDAGGNDTLTFGEGINPGDVTVTQTGDGNHLVLSIAGTTDKVTMERAITDGDYRIEKVGFADGTTWSYADLVVMSAVATAEADTIYGDSFANTLSGLAGNDTLRGRGGNDTLIGGTGNDVLTGGAGDDTYVFNLGDGQDIVRDYGGHWSDAGGNDTLTFGEGINPGDVTVTQTGDGNHLVLSIAGTTDKVTMERAITDGDYRIEKVGFADGTTWSYADLVVMSAVATAEADTIYGDSFANTLSGLAGNDTLRGRGGNDTLIGGTGNDVLTGGAGDDTYVFNLGDGQDIVRDYGGHWSDAGGNDTLTFGEGINPGDVTVTQTGDGNHLVLSIAGTTDKVTMERAITDGDYRIEKVGFADGTTWSYADLVVMSAVATAEADTIYGDSFANTLSGLAGNDTLRGRGGNDTLIGGTGNDVLTGGAGDDTYVFNLGDGQDIVRDYGGHWSDAGGNDTLTFGEGINPGDVTVTQTGDGNHLVLSIAGTTDKVTMERAITDGDYRIEKVGFADGTTWSYADLVVMSAVATAEADTIYGDSFANTLSGLAGNDTLRGRGGNDTLIGGTGNDVLTGGAGDDTYVFNLGDGQDIVRDYGGHWSDAGGNDTLTFGEGINPGDVTVTQTGDGNHLVLSIAGTTDKVTMERAITDGDYRIEKVGFADGTTWSYADLVVMSAVATAEADTIYGDSFANTLSGLAGNDTLRGRGGNDTLIGGTGNDVLTGGAGDDTYVFNLGDGQDIVRDYGGHWSDAGGNDTLTFGEGINPGDVTVTQIENGRDLVLSINGTTDKVTIERAINGTDYRIEQVRFADGSAWSHADLVARSTQLTANLGPQTPVAESNEVELSEIAIIKASYSVMGESGAKASDGLQFSALSAPDEAGTPQLSGSNSSELLREAALGPNVELGQPVIFDTSRAAPTAAVPGAQMKSESSQSPAEVGDSEPVSTPPEQAATSNLAAERKELIAADTAEVVIRGPDVGAIPFDPARAAADLLRRPPALSLNASELLARRQQLGTDTEVPASTGPTGANLDKLIAAMAAFQDGEGMGAIALTGTAPLETVMAQLAATA